MHISEWAWANQNHTPMLRMQEAFLHYACLFKDRIAELNATRDRARLDAERAEDAIDRAGPSITPQALKTFARTARKRMRTESGGYRRDHLRALAQRVEVDQKELRIMGSKKRAPAHAGHRIQRKNGWFWRAQFCTEVARQTRFEPASRHAAGAMNSAR